MKRRFLYVVPCTAVAWTVWTLLSTALAGEPAHLRKGRLPLAEREPISCIPSGIDAFPGDFLTQEQRRSGGVVVHAFIVCYVCAMLAVVCDEYFVPALEVIAEKLKLSPDVAGATFMAMGASAPELFSSIAAVVLVSEEGAKKSHCLRLWHAVMWLPSLLFRLSIPPVTCYPVTFAMSIVWMGGLSYIAVWMVTIIGYTLSIPDSVSGLTLLAAGSSVPDLIATVVIAKGGKGNMAISNLLGSNTFDLAFCLGVPWLIKTITSGSGRLLVYSSAMIYTVSTLLVTLIALLLTFHLNGWKINKISGMVCLLLYAACTTLACLYELNVLGDINKPTCS